MVRSNSVHRKRVVIRAQTMKLGKLHRDRLSDLWADADAIKSQV
jgi:hypothetical protein